MVPAISASVCGQITAPCAMNTIAAAEPPFRLVTKFFATLAER